MHKFATAHHAVSQRWGALCVKCDYFWPIGYRFIPNCSAIDLPVKDD